MVATVSAVLFILNRGVTRQTEAALGDLRKLSLQHVKSENNILRHLIGEHISSIQNLTLDASRQETIREGTAKGQWKAIYGYAESLCKREY